MSLKTGVLLLLGQHGVNCVQNTNRTAPDLNMPYTQSTCSTVGLKHCGLILSPVLSHVPPSENEGIREKDEREG